jgi:hypothetical protein
VKAWHRLLLTPEQHRAFVETAEIAGVRPTVWQVRSRERDANRRWVFAVDARLTDGEAAALRLAGVDMRPCEWYEVPDKEEG